MKRMRGVLEETRERARERSRTRIARVLAELDLSRRCDHYGNLLRDIMRLVPRTSSRAPCEQRCEAAIQMKLAAHRCVAAGAECRLAVYKRTWKTDKRFFSKAPRPSAFRDGGPAFG